jgi:hypothetical protein
VKPYNRYVNLIKLATCPRIAERKKTATNCFLIRKELVARTIGRANLKSAASAAYGFTKTELSKAMTEASRP